MLNAVIATYRQEENRHSLKPSYSLRVHYSARCPREFEEDTMISIRQHVLMIVISTNVPICSTSNRKEWKRSNWQ